MASCLAHTDISGMEQEGFNGLPSRVIGDLKRVVQAQEGGTTILRHFRETLPRPEVRVGGVWARRDQGYSGHVDRGL
jgi:hypothetical protein